MNVQIGQQSIGRLVIEVYRFFISIDALVYLGVEKVEIIVLDLPYKSI